MPERPGSVTPMAIFKNWWVRFTLTLLVLVGCHLVYGGIFSQLPSSTMPSDSQPDRVEGFLQTVWDGKAAPVDLDPLLRGKGLCWVSGYRGGYPATHQLSMWKSRGSALSQLLADPQLREMEAVEVGLATTLKNYNHEPVARHEVGLWGLLFRCTSGDLCLVPAEFSRRSLLPEIQSIKFRGERTVLRQAKFQAWSWVLRRDSEYLPRLMVRGESLVPPDSISRETISQAAREIAEYEQRMVKQKNGLLPYTFILATGVSSEDERNMVKVCLGSLSLASYARFTGREADRQIAELHLKTMIARFGHRFEGRASITDSEVAWLGPQALFGQALRTLPRPDLFCQKFEQELAQTVLDCLQPDGHFLSSLAVPGSPPPEVLDIEKDENQNPFPGMALMYLTRRSQEDAALVPLPTLDRALKYYLDRFRRRPDKAAVPWLTEACRQRFRIDQDRLSAENVFLLADWNLDNIQDWNSMEAQMRGAVINPERLQYGASCFTSDVGCQLQGLVAAHSVALAKGDQARTKRYSTAILEMSRYLRQLQIRQKGDLYWLPTNLRESPQGGLRDALWTSKMSVDSSASALNAWTEWLSTTAK